MKLKPKNQKEKNIDIKKEFKFFVSKLVGGVDFNFKKYKTTNLNPVNNHRFLRAKKRRRNANFIINNKFKVWFGRIFLFFVLFIFLTLFIGVLGLLGLIMVYSKDLPNIDKYLEQNRNLGRETIIYDRNGVEIYRLRGEIINERLKYNEVPKKLEAAILAAEDANFRSHKGLDFFGLARALSCVAINYLQGKSTSSCPGGSSITQQLIKKTTAMEERTYERKIKEMILAMKLEEELTKDEILEFYMNIVPQGREYVGIKTGAIYLFGKRNLNDLTLAEIAFLAGIPNNPEVLSPRGVLYDQEKSINRAIYVLDRMLEESGRNGIFVTKEEIDAAKAELYNVKFVEDVIEIKAPHFVNHLVVELDKEYANKVPEGKRGSDYFRDKGYKIISTVDLSVQQLLEKTIKERVESPQFQNMSGAQNASAVVVDNKTGEVIAMVGSRDFYATSNDKRFAPKFNSATSPRSMGSSVKPILYLTMFTKGYNPSSVLPDLPLDQRTSGTGNPYIPQNFNRTFRSYTDPRTGRGDFITIRQALRYSLNQPAVSGLSIIGVDAFADMYVKLTGNESLRPLFKGVSSALGASNIPLLDQVHAYTTIADYGTYKPLKYVLEIRDENDNVVLNNRQVKSKKVIDPKFAYVITNLNEDYFIFPNSPTVAEIRKRTDFAGKTGTSDSSTGIGDIVFIGYTPTVTIGIWAGNSCGPDECPLKNTASSEKLFEMVFGPFIREYVKILPQERFNRNVQGVKRVTLCSLTGNLYSEDCANAGGRPIEEIVPNDPKPEFLIEKLNVTECNGEIKLARDVDRIVGLAFDKYFVRYDKLFPSNYLSSQVYKYLTTGLNSLNRNWIVSDPITTELCNVTRNTNPPEIIINKPQNGEIFLIDSKLEIQATVISEIPILKVEIAINNVIQKEFKQGEDISLSINLNNLGVGEHKIKVIATNTQKVESVKEITFKIISPTPT